MAADNSMYNFPAVINGRIVNSIIYDKQGDAIYTSSIPGVGGTDPSTFPIIKFFGKADIVGGRGKFATASGQIDFDGTFHAFDQNDATYNANGTISY
jgi:hypothetical protein